MDIRLVSPGTLELLPGICGGALDALSIWMVRAKTLDSEKAEIAAEAYQFARNLLTTGIEAQLNSVMSQAQKLTVLYRPCEGILKAVGD